MPVHSGDRAVVTFYKLIPKARAPMRADRSAFGTLPTRAFRYCEPIAAAAAFGWYLFPPLDFSLQWDGTDVIWTYKGAAGWFPLKSAQYPGYAKYFDGIAPPECKGFAYPLLGTLLEPGLVQLWTGLMVRTRKDWSILVRPPANLSRSQGYEAYEGIVESDRWFGPLFIAVRLTKTNSPIRFSNDYPFAQLQPLHRSTYAEDVLSVHSLVDGIASFTAQDWEHYRQTVVKPNVDPDRRLGTYAVVSRRGRRSKFHVSGDEAPEDS